jgi:Rad3-related DNA helicase/DNA polymerase III epsilon subunit-like protein
VAIDLETTGLNAETDAIIEIGAVRFAGDRKLETFETLVAANTLLPYRIQRLTGIKPGDLRRALPLAPVLPRLRAFVGEAPLVGHNVAFDAAFLRRAGILAHNPLIDTYELASMLLPQLPSYTLTAVGAALGLSSPERHRALADADLARRVFLALHDRLQDLDTGALEALHALPASREWTLGYLVRAELRARREASGSAFAGALTASLGDQLARKLGVDPAVLTLAGAASSTVTATVPAPPAAAQSPDSAAPPVSDTGADARLEGATARIGAALAADGPLLVEIEHDRPGLLATLTAALRWAATTGRRLAIAAADGETSRRIAREIVPVALGQLGSEAASLSIAEVAEREAYLCLWRWFGMARADSGAPLSRDVTRGMTKLLTWSRQTTSGRRADVALSGQEQLAWERVRAGRELLDSASNCPYDKRGHCFLSAAQSAGQAAQVVVTTQAALAARLAGLDDLLPSTDRVLVLDAHLFEEQLRATRSVVLDRADLLALLAQLAETRPDGRAGLLHLAAAHVDKQLGASGSRGSERAWFDAVARARRCVESFFAALQPLMAETDNDRLEHKRENNRPQGEQPDQRALRIDERVRRSRAWDEALRAWQSLARDLGGLTALLREVATTTRAADRKLAGSGSGLPLELLGMARRLDALVAGGNTIVADEQSENIVSWLRVPYPQLQDRRHPAEMRQSRGRGGRGQAQKPIAKQTQVAGPATSPAADPAAGPVAADAEVSPLADVAAGETAVPAASSGADAGEPHLASPPPDARSAPATRGNDTPSDEIQEYPVAYAAPAHVGALLSTLLASGRGVVLASPALSVAGDFEHVRGSLGLPEAIQGLRLTADRSAQTLLCLPSDVPEPNAPHYQRALEDALIALATALAGRLVAIFPSHAALRSSYNGIRRALEARDILVLAQGQDGSARQLWQQFATERRIVLLGAGVFWDGSVQRQPPACVVVTRLPFPALSDPLLAARADAWEDPQSQFVVPQAALKLRHALSGLAWSHSARNAVVLFDRRAQTRGYGSTVLGTLPPCSQHQEPVAQLAERIAEWVGPA